MTVCVSFASKAKDSAVDTEKALISSIDER